MISSVSESNALTQAKGPLGRAAQHPFRLSGGATEVVLVRHGASADAVAGVSFPLVDGRSDPPLSPDGERQAVAVAERLARDDISALFITPLRRTAATAAPLAAAVGLDATVVEDLAEVRLGDWEGGEYRLRAANGDPLVKRAFEQERWDIIPNAESPESLARRVRTGIESVVAATGPGAVAVAVVHGGVIGEACRQATDSRPFAFVHSDNGSLTRVVVWPDGRWMVRSFNDVSHLPAHTVPVGLPSERR
jgi:2,3-bisphosphoglycerate-dependent phosphoglycerate mutase